MEYGRYMKENTKDRFPEPPTQCGAIKENKR